MTERRVLRKLGNVADRTSNGSSGEIRNETLNQLVMDAKDLKIKLLNRVAHWLTLQIAPHKGMKEYQHIFEMLHNSSLGGLNYGDCDKIETNGERWVLEYLSNRTKNPVIFDVGANQGQYAKTILQIFGQTPFTAYSFEPSPKVYRQLIKNVTDGRFSFHELALSDQSGQSVLFSPGNNSELGSLYQRNLAHANIQMNQRQDIQLNTLDEFCREKQIDSIDFMKIDTEGNELKVLQGAQGMLESGKIKYIQFEFGGTAIDSRIYVKDFFLLLGDKYNICQILRDGIRPLHYSESLEIFVSNNFFAQLK